MTNSRTKGRAAEQEVAGILRDELGLEIHRNWQQQAAQGGCDLITVPDIGWGIEIKRAKEVRLSEWWQQTAEQAQIGVGQREQRDAVPVGLHLGAMARNERAHKILGDAVTIIAFN